jgi:hypothetical protein
MRNSKFQNNEQLAREDANHKFKDIEEAIQKAIDSELTNAKVSLKKQNTKSVAK